MPGWTGADPERVGALELVRTLELVGIELDVDMECELIDAGGVPELAGAQNGWTQW